MCVCLCGDILTLIFLPVDYSCGSQSNKSLSVFFGHGGAEHLERAQFALRHWKQTDQTETMFIMQHRRKSCQVAALNLKLKQSV